MSSSTKPRVPDFLIIGAMKAGTTSLHEMLAAYPDIAAPSCGKEPHTLVKDLPPQELIDEYGQMFPKYDRPCLLRFESSTGYTKLPAFSGTAERARTIVGPDLKLIYLVRDPIDRLVSHRRYMTLDRRIPEDINRAVNEWSELTDYSCYSRQLDAWREQFPDEQIHVELFESFIADPQAAVGRVRRFLGLPDAEVYRQAAEHHNRSDRLARNTPLANALRHLPFARRVVPARWRQRVGRLVKRPVPTASIHFERSTLEALVRRFQPDNRYIADYMGLRGMPWDLDATAARYYSSEPATT